MKSFEVITDPKDLKAGNEKQKQRDYRARFETVY